MKDSIIRDKSFDFALRIINLFKYLKNKIEFVISKQILRAGTSIGANVREALSAESKPDFIHKLSIAQKECDETYYWLELLFKSEYLSKNEFDSINKECIELLKIIKSIIITSKNSIRK
jgi:four helix bundle protein